MTIFSLSVGSGLSSSSDPPPPGGNGGRRQELEITKLCIAIMCVLFAIFALIFGIRSLVNPRGCGDAGSFGLFHGIAFLMVSFILAFLSPSRSRSRNVYLNNEPQNSPESASISVNREPAEASTFLLRNLWTRSRNFGRRIVASYQLRNLLVLRVLTVIISVFLLICGVAFIAMSGICMHSELSSSYTRLGDNSRNIYACLPIAVMNITSGMVEAVVGIGVLLSLYLGNLFSSILRRGNGLDIQASTVDRVRIDEDSLTLLVVRTPGFRLLLLMVRTQENGLTLLVVRTQGVMLFLLMVRTQEGSLILLVVRQEPNFLFL